MEENPIIEKSEEFMIHSFLDYKTGIPRVLAEGIIRHNVQVREYVIQLAKMKKEKDTTALEIAALLHNIWRAVAHQEKYAPIRDESYKESHEKNSAMIAEKFLKDLKANPELVKRVKNLIAKHHSGGSREADMLKEADGLSFLENTLPTWFEAGLWMGKSNEELLKVARMRLDKELKRLKSPESKKIAKRFYEKWEKWLEQKLLG